MEKQLTYVLCSVSTSHCYHHQQRQLTYSSFGSGSSTSGLQDGGCLFGSEGRPPRLQRAAAVIKEQPSLSSTPVQARFPSAHQTETRGCRQGTRSTSVPRATVPYYSTVMGVAEKERKHWTDHNGWPRGEGDFRSRMDHAFLRAEISTWPLPVITEVMRVIARKSILSTKRYVGLNCDEDAIVRTRTQQDVRPPI